MGWLCKSGNITDYLIERGASRGRRRRSDGAPHPVADTGDLLLSGPGHAAAALLKIADAAEAVVFEIKEPLRVIEWLRPPDWSNGLDAWRH